MATIDTPRAVRVKTSTGWADLAIEGPQGQTGPPGAQGPQGVQGGVGPQGPAGAGVPMPVVNGQWVKGVGGAAVWSAIADTDVPALNIGQRLGTTGVVVTNANSAIANGWYYMNPGGTNAPPGSDYVSIFVVELNGPGNVRQIAYAYNVDTAWMRRLQDTNNWGAWVQVYPVPDLVGQSRLGSQAQQHSDWNTVGPTGFYMAAGAANAPDGNWWIGLNLAHIPGAWQVQILWGFTQWPLPRYQRACQNGGWQGWVAW
jgi:hypothetical protein